LLLDRRLIRVRFPEAEVVDVRAAARGDATPPAETPVTRRSAAKLRMLGRLSERP
jgi:hypothetical protein